MTSNDLVSAPSRAAAATSSGARLRQWLPELDGLRGIAILIVVVHNVGFDTTPGSSRLMRIVYNLHAQGWMGVPLFFALSGFLITGILLDSEGPNRLRSFWIRRALRIFPLYFATLAAGTWVIPRLFGAQYPFVGLEHQIWYWTYLCNWVQVWGRDIAAFSHFWSLAVEEQFYFVWPLVVLSLGRRQLLRLCLVIAAAALVFRFGLRLAGIPPLGVYQYTCTRMDALTLGAAAAVAARDPKWLAWAAPRLSRTLLAAGIALLAMVPFTHGLNREEFWVQTIGFALVDLFCAALVFQAAVDPGARTSGWLRTRWLQWFGKYSYAIYVFHYPIARILHGRFIDAVNQEDGRRAFVALLVYATVVLASSSVAAVVSWNVLERWALQLKDRWAPRAKGAGTVEPASAGEAVATRQAS